MGVKELRGEDVKIVDARSEQAMLSVLLAIQPVDCPVLAATHVQKWDEAARPSTQADRRPTARSSICNRLMTFAGEAG